MRCRLLCVFLLAAGHMGAQAPEPRAAVDWDALQRESVQNLRDYIRINTSNPPGNELEGARFMMTSSEFFHVLEDVDIDPVEYAKHVRVQYT